MVEPFQKKLTTAQVEALLAQALSLGTTTIQQVKGVPVRGLKRKVDLEAQEEPLWEWVVDQVKTMDLVVLGRDQAQVVEWQAL
jgi:hypothetical protein